MKKSNRKEKNSLESSAVCLFNFAFNFDSIDRALKEEVPSVSESLIVREESYFQDTSLESVLKVSQLTNNKTVRDQKPKANKFA